MRRTMHTVSSLFLSPIAIGQRASDCPPFRLEPSTCIGLPKMICHPQGCLMRLLGSRRQRILFLSSKSNRSCTYRACGDTNTEKCCAEKVSKAQRLQVAQSEASRPGSSFPQILVRSRRSVRHHSFRNQHSKPHSGWCKRLSVQ